MNRPGELEKVVTAAVEQAQNLWTAAAGVLATTAGATPFPDTVPAGPVPASFAQERIITLATSGEPQPAVYNVPLAWEVEGQLDEKALRSALAALALSCDSLRSRFIDNGDTILLDTAPSVEIPLRHTIAASLASAKALALEDAREPFDLFAAPLVRALWIEVPQDRQLLQFVFHQTIIDGMSLRLISRRFAATYAAAVNDQPLAQDPSPAPAAKAFAVWQHTVWPASVSAACPSFEQWTRMISAPFDPMNLPYIQTERRRETGPLVRVPFVIPSTTVSRLAEVSRAAGVSNFVTLLASLGILIHRYSSQPGVLLFVTAACRFRPEMRRMIGLVANILPFRIDLSGSPTLRQLLTQVNEFSLQAFTHQATPFERLITLLRPRPSQSGPRALAQVQFLFNNSALPALDVPGARLAPIHDIDTGWMKPDVIIEASESAGSLAGSWKFRSDLFPAGLPAHITGNWIALLSELANTSDQ